MSCEMAIYEEMMRNDLLLMAMIVCVFIGLAMSIIQLNKEMKELKGGKRGKKNR